MFPWEAEIVDGGKSVEWKVVGDALHQWGVMPTFLVGEGLFYLGSLLALLHAVAQPTRKAHLFIWLAAFVAGSANDLFFMALPVVDNFWQAQAVIVRFFLNQKINNKINNKTNKFISSSSSSFALMI